VSPQQAQISVDPTYVLHLESGRIRLSATLKYEVRRTSIYGVNVHLPNWRIDQVLPETIVDVPSLDRDKREPLYVPLKATAVQEDGEFTVQIEAVYTAEPADDVVSVVLPRPEAKLSTTATVVVLPADNVAVTVVDEQLQGLERESFPPPDIQLPQRQQSPLVYRERSDTKSAVFVAEVGRRERSVSIAPACHMDVAASRVKVRETLDYRIAYEPLRTIQLAAQRSLIQPENLQILEGKEALPFVVLAHPSSDAGSAAKKTGESADDDLVHLEVDLLSDRIGRWSATIEYVVPLTEPRADGPSSIRVPLVLPVIETDTTLTSYTLDVDTGDDLQFRVIGDQWEAVDEQHAPDLAGTLISRLPPSSVELVVSRPQGGPRASTVVRKAWYQTWLQTQRRRDRAVFEITTSEEQIVVRLPSGATFQCAAVDGRLATTDLDPREQQDEVTVKIPDSQETRPRVVELWYFSPGEELSSGAVDLDPAVIKNASRSSLAYWSLATPSTDHLLLSPRDATPEMAWVRRGIFWHRAAGLDQSDLERWIGASAQESLPASLNNYLFSTFGQTTTLRCFLAPRSMILLAVSGSALLVGLLLIRFRALRHPALVFAVGLTLVSTVLLYPDLATAACQASLLGIGLVLSAVLLKWIVDWRQARRSVIRGTTFASPDSKTVKAAAALSLDEHPAQAPATTASMSVDEPVGEASA
jgi:hypothetical protein